MRIVQTLSLLTVLSVRAFGANFSMVAVGAFGEPLSECRVESFQSTATQAKYANDYKDRFRGLAASDLPDGDYRVNIGCREARIGAYVKVSNVDRFEVISDNRRIMRSGHLTPHLVVRMDDPRPPGETWWLTLRALYNKRSDTVEFQRDTGEATVADPDPGSYVVSVLSSAGYNCLREIDLVERTRFWTLDPTSCT